MEKFVAALVLIGLATFIYMNDFESDDGIRGSVEGKTTEIFSTIDGTSVQ